MSMSHFATMSAYNRWANARLYDACAGLSDAARKQDRRAFFRSIHNTLNHILLGDRAWLDRIEATGAEMLALDTVLFDDFDALRQARAAEDDRIDRVLARLDGTCLAEDLSYRSLAGESHRTPLCLVLTHLFNHQTHHRGQVHNMLGQAGVSPPGLDLIYYLRTLPA